MIIQSSEERDSGRYTCIAENAVGKTVYEVFITITAAEGGFGHTCVVVGSD